MEQDHRFIKRRVNPGMGFVTENTARRTLRGYEAMNMIRSGQIQGVEKGDILGQVERPRVVGCFSKSSRLTASVSQIFPFAA